MFVHVNLNIYRIKTRRCTRCKQYALLCLQYRNNVCIIIINNAIFLNDQLVLLTVLLVVPMVTEYNLRGNV